MNISSLINVSICSTILKFSSHKSNHYFVDHVQILIGELESRQHDAKIAEQVAESKHNEMERKIAKMAEISAQKEGRSSLCNLNQRFCLNCLKLQ